MGDNVPPRNAAVLLVPRALASRLMRLYDFPDPRKPGRVIHGYDCPHARRTARMCAAVARRDRKSTRLNSSHIQKSRMPSSA